MRSDVTALQGGKLLLQRGSKLIVSFESSLVLEETFVNTDTISSADIG